MLRIIARGLPVTPSNMAGLFVRSNDHPAPTHSHTPRERAVHARAARLPERLSRRTVFAHRRHTRLCAHSLGKTARTAFDSLRLADRQLRKPRQAYRQGSRQARFRADDSRSGEISDYAALVRKEFAHHHEYLRRRRAAG